MPYASKEKAIEHRRDYYLKNKDRVLKGIQKYRLENPDAIKKSQRKYYNANKDVVNEKRRVRWAKYYDSTDGKVNEKARKKKYRANNLEKCKALEEKSRLKNKQKISARQATWYKTNRKEINQKRMADRNSDKVKKLRFNISSLVREKLKRRLLGKNGAGVFTMLPYTIDELITHLENQFKDGMTWENYGKWHIDHRTPDSSFDYKSVTDVPFQESWSLRNLQPLWAKDNLSKGKKLI